MMPTSDSEALPPTAADEAKAAQLRPTGGGGGQARAAVGKTLMVVTSRLLAMFVSLVGLYCYTRLMQKSEWAAGLVAALLGEALFALGDLGLGLCLERRLPAIMAQDRQEGLVLIGVFTLVVGASASLCAVLLFVMKDWLALWFLKDASLGFILAWGIPFSISIMWRNGLFCVMRGTNCYGRLSVLSLSTQVCFVAGTVSGYLLWGVRGFVIGACASYVFPCAYETWVLRRYLGTIPTLAGFRRYIRLSLSMFGERIVNFAYAFADQFIVGLVLTPAALATYQIPRSFFERFGTLLDSLWMVPTTLMSRESIRGIDAAKSAMRRLGRMFVYIFTPLGIGLFASSFFLVDVLGGAKYHDAATPFAILALHYLVMGLAAANAIVGITTLAHPRERFKTLVIKNLAYLAILPPLAHWFMLNGVVGARLAATIIEAVVATYLMRRLLQAKWESGAVRVVLAPALLLFVIVAGGQYLLYTRWVTPIYMALGAAVYLYLFFRYVAEEDLAFLENAMPGWLRPVLAVGRRCRPQAARG